MSGCYIVLVVFFGGEFENAAHGKLDCHLFGFCGYIVSLGLGSYDVFKNGV